MFFGDSSRNSKHWDHFDQIGGGGGGGYYGGGGACEAGAGGGSSYTSPTYVTSSFFTSGNVGSGEVTLYLRSVETKTFNSTNIYKDFLFIKDLWIVYLFFNKVSIVFYQYCILYSISLLLSSSVNQTVLYKLFLAS